MEKSLDRKWRQLAARPGGEDFILADAKDADVAYAIGPASFSPELHAHELRVRDGREYRDRIRSVVRDGLIDLILLAPQSAQALVARERLFATTPVTPAVRVDDPGDVPYLPAGTMGWWTFSGGATVEGPHAPLVLECLEGIPPSDPSSGRPRLIFVPDQESSRLRDIVRAHPRDIIGVLAGPGAARDAFALLENARQAGVRAAMIGRRLNQAEHEEAFLRVLRMVADGKLSAELALRVYDAVLEHVSSPLPGCPVREVSIMSSATDHSAPQSCGGKDPKSCSCGCKKKAASGSESTSGPPDFAAMTSAERWAYHRARIARRLGH